MEELPAKIGVHVRKMLGKGVGAGGALRLKAFRPGNTEVEVEVEEEGKGKRRRVTSGRAIVVPRDFHELRKSFDEMRRNLNNGVLEDLREQIESLRREVEKLQDSPSDK